MHWDECKGSSSSPVSVNIMVDEHRFTRVVDSNIPCSFLGLERKATPVGEIRRDSGKLEELCIP